MSPRTKDLSGIIVGPLRIIELTDQRDSSKCTIWKAECVCGETVYGSRPVLERYAGPHSVCPGHERAPREKVLNDFILTPDLRGTNEQARVLELWQAARDGYTNMTTTEEIIEKTTVNYNTDEAAEQHTVIASKHIESNEENTNEEPPAPAEEAALEAPVEAPSSKTKRKSENGSAILRDRLGLDAYHCETFTLPNAPSIAGAKAVKAVFAKQIDGDDRVLLHLELIKPDGKRKLISAMKKLSTDELTNITAELEQLNIAWRMKDTRQARKS